MNKIDVWKRTATGKIFFLFSPQRSAIAIDDIVQSLARICRYGGGVRWPLHYSVAEHSVILARYVLDRYPDRPMLAMQALMHDAAEAHIGDMIRPLKDTMPEFITIDNQITSVIFKHFNIPWPLDPIIKEIDTRILMDEEAQVLVPCDINFDYLDVNPLDVRLYAWEREEAYRQFFVIWSELWAQIGASSRFRRAVV